MAWLELTLLINPAQIEQTEALLEQLGSLAITLSDAGDQPILEPLPDQTPLWQEIKLSALFAGQADLEQIQSELYKSQLITQSEKVLIKRIENQDWTRSWLDRFEPMQFGDRLWICPRHISPPQPDAINLRLDPGLAFGTGTHETTAMCLSYLDSMADLEHKTVLDFGCGSGVLAIAALLLGADTAYCVDIDPQAHEATLANAADNQVSNHIKLIQADQLPEHSFDLIMANILAGPLIELAPTLCQHIKPGGQIILSGILKDQSEAVKSAYQPYCSDFDVQQDNDWIRITASCIPSV